MTPVTAYRHAIKVYTQDDMPLDWAMTQNNLGNALRALGEREEGTQRLDDAVTAHRHAIKVYTQDDMPLQWAITQNNLGTAFEAIGDKTSDSTKWQEAENCYLKALEVWDENAPHYASIAMRNLDRVRAKLKT